jgi:LuxR family maltose regulon positive regulatory protein
MCSGAGTSQKRSTAPSHWQIYASRKVDFAMRTYERALRLASEQGGAVARGTADIYVGMSELQRERNELDAATLSLHRSQELGEQSGFSQNRYR